MASEGGHGEGLLLLICRVGSCLCGIPLPYVVETMRPLPVEPLPNLPGFVDGLSLIRGRPTPVLDARRLLGQGASPRPCERYVTIRLGERSAALAVDAVLGVRGLERGRLGDLPPLLREPGNELVLALATLDRELLLVLERSRMVPDSVWTALAAGAAVN